MIADSCAVAHLKVESVLVGLHLFEGREDINLSVPASPVTTHTYHFANTFVVAQLIHLNTHVAGFDSIAAYKTDCRERDN
ncbi:Uncharacterised protein [Enterobacter cloacae]|nr:Uncharacterised protein [Enterobacter cloacae]